MLTKTAIRSSWTLLRITHIAHRMSCLTTPIHMKSLYQKWNYVKLKSIWTLLRITFLDHMKSYNNAENHSPNPYKVMSDYPQLTWKVDQKLNYVTLESVWTLLRITRLAHRKSHIWSLFAPIYMQNWPKVNWVKLKSVETLLRITHLAHMKPYLVIMCSHNSYEKVTKSEIWSSWSRFKHC